jgi:acyl carrier protein
MENKLNIFEEVLAAINEVKRTGFTLDSVEPDFYLGGDFGIDPREMLEIWYEIEQRLGIELSDADKRDPYTLEDVASVIGAYVGDRAITA